MVDIIELRIGVLMRRRKFAGLFGGVQRRPAMVPAAARHGRHRASVAHRISAPCSKRWQGA